MNEQAYFLRQQMLSGLSPSAHQSIRTARILVVGCGGLGNPVLAYLAGCGFGSIRFCDGDTVEISNLHRQFFFTQEQIGQTKVEVALDFLQKRYPFTHFEGEKTWFSVETSEALLQGIDLVIDCTDRPDTRLLIDETCAEKSIPWVFAGVYGFELQTSIFNSEKNYRKAFGTNTSFSGSCSENGTIPIVPGLAAMYQVIEAVRYFAFPEKTEFGKLKLINLIDDQSFNLTF